MAWFRNHYICDRCGHHWEDEWSCACNDDCPSCGFRHLEPQDSEDLSVLIERDNEGRYLVRYSPGSAGHYPDYILSHAFADKGEAERHAREIAHLTYEEAQ